MDQVICAVCIAALYNPLAPLQCRDTDGRVMPGPINTLDELKNLIAQGCHVFEPGGAIAIGYWASTLVKGVAMCSTHAMYVVNRLDLAKL